MAKIKTISKTVFISTTGKKFFTRRGEVQCSIAALIRKVHGNCDCGSEGSMYGHSCYWYELGDDPRRQIRRW